MKVIVFYNPGEIDPLAFQLMGASTKRDDKSQIGMFGSGAKYALAYLKRDLGIIPRVFSGEREIDIKTEVVTMRGKHYERFVIDGQGTSITTDMGPNWEKWMALRELYANAIDEGGGMGVEDDSDLARIESVRPGTTTIILPYKPFQAEMQKQDVLFCRNREVAYEDDRLKIYQPRYGTTTLHVKGILVHTADTEANAKGYGFELKETPFAINEERLVKNASYASSALAAAIMGIEDRMTVAAMALEMQGKTFLHDAIFDQFKGWMVPSALDVNVSRHWKPYVFQLATLVNSIKAEVAESNEVILCGQPFLDWIKTRGGTISALDLHTACPGYEKRIKLIEKLYAKFAPPNSKRLSLVVSSVSTAEWDEDTLYYPVHNFSGATNQFIAAKMIAKLMDTEEMALRLINNDIQIP